MANLDPAPDYLMPESGPRPPGPNYLMGLKLAQGPAPDSRVQVGPKPICTPNYHLSIQEWIYQQMGGENETIWFILKK